MAIRTAVEEQALPPCVSGCIHIHVPGVALQAEEWHCCIKKIVVYGTVGGVAVGAVLGNITMFIGERPLFLHVASGACLLWRIPLEEFFLGGAVGIMTVYA